MSSEIYRGAEPCSALNNRSKAIRSDIGNQRSLSNTGVILSYFGVRVRILADMFGTYAGQGLVDYQVDYANLHCHSQAEMRQVRGYVFLHALSVIDFLILLIFRR